MKENVKEAIAAIERQQRAAKERSAVWMVGEQLKELCRREPGCAPVLLEDLQVPELSLEKAEKQIRAYADKHRVGNFACVTPTEAEGILREFYGLEQPEAAEAAPEPTPPPGNIVSIFDLL